MNIGYIKLDNPKEGFLNSIFYKIRKSFNFIYKDKYRDKVYYICNVNEKSVNKLVSKLKRDNIDYIIAEKYIKIDYPKLTGKFSLKYMLPEVVKYCFTLANFKLDEIFICTNNYTEENKQIIEDLTSYVKVVNVVTDNSRNISLEKQLERKGIYITVNNNKRKSLKRANVVINFDGISEVAIKGNLKANGDYTFDENEKSNLEINIGAGSELGSGETKLTLYKIADIDANTKDITYKAGILIDNEGYKIICDNEGDVKIEEKITPSPQNHSISNLSSGIYAIIGTIGTNVRSIGIISLPYYSIYDEEVLYTVSFIPVWERGD